ncbi:hypothetical protein CDD83_643 [Cordyceps sp. RAO-2017]|nr:hypothetical protein CDD83_643 [Cordyceps sp. RAO-2017]
MRRSTVSVTALVAGLASAAAAQNGTASCATGLHLIVARGTSEPKGAGVTGLLADRIERQIAGSRVAPLDYPATLSKPDYEDSVAAGVQAMRSAVEQYAQECPRSKVAIMGYSQGAQVSMDTLCGGTGAGFRSSTPLPAKLVKDNVVAIVLFGDPTHVANITYDRGTSVKDGIFQRDNGTVRTCEAYADRMVSYCDTGDIYCDSGEDNKVHGLYVPRYGDEVVKYVVGRYHDSVKGEGGGRNSSASSTATAAPTSSSATASATGARGSSGTASAAPGRFVADSSVYLALSSLALAALQALL